MAISPTRAFALGACSVVLVAGVFVAGIGIGSRNGADPMTATPPPDAKVSCPGAPGFTATRASDERAANCENAQRVQAMLLKSGASTADVSVRRRETGELLGPESVIEVTAQVHLPEELHGAWDAEGAALAISRELGTTSRRVTIVDERLRTLYDGEAEAVRAAQFASGASSVPPRIPRVR